MSAPREASLGVRCQTRRETRSRDSELASERGRWGLAGRTLRIGRSPLRRINERLSMGASRESDETRDSEPRVGV